MQDPYFATLTRPAICHFAFAQNCRAANRNASFHIYNLFHIHNLCHIYNLFHIYNLSLVQFKLSSCQPKCLIPYLKLAIYFSHARQKHICGRDPQFNKPNLMNISRILHKFCTICVHNFYAHELESQNQFATLQNKQMCELKPEVWQ